MIIIPIKELKDTVGVEKKCAENDVVYVTKNGYGSLVMMTIQQYNRMFALLQDVKRLNDGITDSLDGNVTPADKVFAALSSKHNL